MTRFWIGLFVTPGTPLPAVMRTLRPALGVSIGTLRSAMADARPVHVLADDGDFEDGVTRMLEMADALDAAGVGYRLLEASAEGDDPPTEWGAAEPMTREGLANALEASRETRRQLEREDALRFAGVDESAGNGPGDGGNRA